MGISNGTLVKREKKWSWKYRVDGEIRWESLKVESKREAELVRQQRIAQYHQDREKFIQEGLNPTVEEFEAEYFAWAETHKRPSTRTMERQFWQQLIDFTGARRLGDIKKRDIERLKSSLKVAGKKGKPLADRSVNAVLRHLQSMFNHAVALDLFNGVNPVQGVKRYKITKTMPEFIDESDVQALLKAAEAHSREIYWVFLLGLHAGLRKGEIVNSGWEWFDFNNHDGPVIRIQRHDGFEIKDHEERSLPMQSNIAQALLPHAQPESFLFGESPASGQRWRYRYEPRRAFDNVKKAAGVKRCNFLMLRHSFASWHVMKGTDISKVSRWLGHSNISITMDHYAGLKAYDKDIENF